MKLFKKVKKINFSETFLFVSIFVTTFLNKIKFASANSFKEMSGLETSGSSAGYTNDLKNISGETLTIQIINLVLTFVGIGFLLLMIYGGITWMTAAGNETKVDKAKKIIISGVIGLIVIFSAYIVSQFVISFFSQETLV